MPELQKCARCGAEISPSAPGGHCLRCALELALSEDDDSSPPGEIPSAGASPSNEPPKPAEPGDRIGRYRLVEQIGKGGFGVVFKAEQEEPIRRFVALKVIKLGMDTRQVITRFEAERQALALMDHPNIAKVLDAGADSSGRPYFVMELVPGPKITDYCDAHKLSLRQRLELFIQVCQAIQHAHQKGVIHRDIKPSNILVSEDNGVPVPKVIDFGIARATQDQRLTEESLSTAFAQFLGTPAYMSPEQAGREGQDIDSRSDIYSLGMLLYELLTAQPAFDADTLRQSAMDEVLRVIREKEPARPSARLTTLTPAQLDTVAQHRQAQPASLPKLLRGDLDWIVMKCLEKDRTRRYETANGLASDLQRHINDEPVLARPPSNVYRLRKMIRRNRLAFAAGTAFVQSLVVGLALSTYLFIQERRAVERAVEAEQEQRQLRTQAEAARQNEAQTRQQAEADEKKAKSEADRAEAAEALAKQRLRESETISKFLAEVFQSPDPARDGRTITVAEALGTAAKRLDTDLANQPALRAKLQATLAQTYLSLGLYHEAILLQERVRYHYLGTSGPEDPDTLEAMGNLAISYDMAGRRDEALKLREEVLPISLKLLGAEHLDTLGAMGNLAISYDEAGRRNEALKLWEEVLPISLKLLGAEHPDTLWAKAYLAISYDEAGRHVEALKLREELLEIYRKVSGPENPDTLKAMGNLAVSYDETGRQDEALKLREKALEIYRKVSGPEHPDTLGAMNNLADSYKKAGRRYDALKLEEEVLELRRKVSGSEHPDTLGAMGNLAYCYDEVGRRDEALKLREEVLMVRRKLIGPENPDTLKAMLEMAISYDESGRLDEALKLREEVLPLCRRINGPEHPDTLMAMLEMAISYDEAGRRHEAFKLREEVLPLCRKVNGPEHLDTLRAMEALAYSYDQVGRRDEALKLREEDLPLRRKVNGPEHPDTLKAMYDLACSYDQTGCQDQALKLLEEVVPLLRKVRGTESPETLSAINNLASSYDKAGRRVEALKLREEVLPLRRKVNGPGHPDTIRAMYNLATSLDEAGRSDEARELRDEATHLYHKEAEQGQVDAQLNLGIMYERGQGVAKDPSEAVKWYRAASEQGNVQALDSLAWILATCDKSEIRNGTNAVLLAEKFVAATSRTNANFLDTLAAAYAETDQFDKAVTVEQEAMTLLQTEQEKKDYDSRLKLYQANKPYHQQGTP